MQAYNSNNNAVTHVPQVTGAMTAWTPPAQRREGTTISTQEQLARYYKRRKGNAEVALPSPEQKLFDKMTRLLDHYETGAFTMAQIENMEKKLHKMELKLIGRLGKDPRVQALVDRHKNVQEQFSHQFAQSNYPVAEAGAGAGGGRMRVYTAKKVDRPMELEGYNWEGPAMTLAPNSQFLPQPGESSGNVAMFNAQPPEFPVSRHEQQRSGMGVGTVSLKKAAPKTKAKAAEAPPPIPPRNELEFKRESPETESFYPTEKYVPPVSQPAPSPQGSMVQQEQGVYCGGPSEQGVYCGGPSEQRVYRGPSEQEIAISRQRKAEVAQQKLARGKKGKRPMGEYTPIPPANSLDATIKREERKQEASGSGSQDVKMEDVFEPDEATGSSQFSRMPNPTPKSQQASGISGGGGAGEPSAGVSPEGIAENPDSGIPEMQEHKALAMQIDAERQAGFDERALNPVGGPDLNARLQVPRDVRRATALPKHTDTYHGPYDRGTLQEYRNAKEMPYGLQVYTGKTAAQVNNENAKRKRQGYILYDDLTKEWTHIKKKDIPKSKASEMSAVFQQAAKKRRIAASAGGPMTGWEHQIREDKTFAESASTMAHSNTQQPGDLQPKPRAAQL